MSLVVAGSGMDLLDGSATARLPEAFPASARVVLLALAALGFVSRVGMSYLLTDSILHPAKEASRFAGKSACPFIVFSPYCLSEDHLRDGFRTSRWARGRGRRPG